MFPDVLHLFFAPSFPQKGQEGDATVILLQVCFTEQLQSKSLLRTAFSETPQQLWATDSSPIRSSVVHKDEDTLLILFPE